MAGGNPNPKLYPGHIALTVNQLLVCKKKREKLGDDNSLHDEIQKGFLDTSIHTS